MRVEGLVAVANVLSFPNARTIHATVMIATAVFVFLLATGALAAAEITGKPRIVDGDTLAFGRQRVRLHGIDAPETKQTCSVDGKVWHCGQEATFAITREIADHRVRCEQRDRDRYGRIVAVCYVGSRDLNAMMVREGWALAYRRYSLDYVGEEAAAKAAGAGLWRGEFEPPWDWRKQKRGR